MNFIKSILCLIILLFFPLAQANSSSHFNLNSAVEFRFNKIKNDPKALYEFFKNMPKGGELHYHLSGGPSPETMLAIAAKAGYCLNPQTLAAYKNTSPCQGIKAKDILKQPKLYAKIIRDWSMQDFVPGKESGHDHFFNSFSKFTRLVFDYRPPLIADIIKRAAQQNEQYLELMTIPDNANAIQFGDLIKNNASYRQKKQLLLSNKKFQDNIAQTVSESERILKQAHSELGCQTNPQAKPCQIKIKFLYYSLREQSLDNLFAQTLNAFEAVSRSQKIGGNLVGVNLVQPEDGFISLRDYHKQMLIFNYFHQNYPQVNISLHAGELTQGTVAPEELRYHIRDALFSGHAQRIGHGVDISYEQDAENTLKYMATHQRPVEINLISNLKILNVAVRNNPLNYYLAHHVPVVLSTDDEGILRTDLTQQYVEAALHQGLDYQTLKQINRNALTFAFVPGKSIWADANKAILVQSCHSLYSKSCQQFVKNNEKAKLQWDLEQKLTAFENQFSESRHPSRDR